MTIDTLINRYTGIGKAKTKTSYILVSIEEYRTGLESLQKKMIHHKTSSNFLSEILIFPKKDVSVTKVYLVLES